MSIIVKIHNGYFYAGKENVPVDGVKTTIKARGGASYELVDEQSGKAPQKIRVDKDKNNLLVSLDGDKDADLIIEDFFLYSESQLIGMGNDGGYYAYLPNQSEFDTLFGEQLNPKRWYEKLIDKTNDVPAVVETMPTVELASYGRVTPWLLEAKQKPMSDLLMPVLGTIGASGLLLLAVENRKKDNNPLPQTPESEAPERPTATINDAGTEVTGTTKANSEVRVSQGDNELGTATAGADGKFKIVLKEAVVDGSSLSVVASVGTANSPALNLTAPDTVVPKPAEEVVINDKGDEVTGKAEARANVQVLDEFDNVLATAAANQEGVFKVSLSLVPQTAEQALKVVVVDAAGNKSTVVALKGTKGDNGVVTTPVDIDGGASNNTVSEDAAVGTKVGITVKSTDYEKVSYSLLDDAGGRFSVDASTGVVTLAGALDFEKDRTHAINVRASSEDGTFRDANFTIRVSNVNDNKISALTDSNEAANQVSTAAKVGDKVGVTARATDPDQGDTVTYSLKDNLGGKFGINADTGEVLVTGDLKQTTGTQKIDVVATSSDGTSSEASFDVLLVSPSSRIVFAANSADTQAVQSASSKPISSTVSAVDLLQTEVTVPLGGVVDTPVI